MFQDVASCFSSLNSPVHTCTAELNRTLLPSLKGLSYTCKSLRNTQPPAQRGRDRAAIADQKKVNHTLEKHIQVSDQAHKGSLPLKPQSGAHLFNPPLPAMGEAARQTKHPPPATQDNTRLISTRLVSKLHPARLRHKSGQRLDEPAIDILPEALNGEGHGSDAGQWLQRQPAPLRGPPRDRAPGFCD